MALLSGWFTKHFHPPFFFNFPEKHTCKIWFLEFLNMPKKYQYLYAIFEWINNYYNKNSKNQNLTKSIVKRKTGDEMLGESPLIITYIITLYNHPLSSETTPRGLTVTCFSRIRMVTLFHNGTALSMAWRLVGMHGIGIAVLYLVAEQSIVM